jgi:uncharacterized protein (TIGR00725 family)
MLVVDRTRRRLHSRTGHIYDAAGRRWVEAPPPDGAEPIGAREAVAFLQRDGGRPFRTPIGVIGPNEATPEQERVAEEVGALVAGLGLAVLCGGRQGVMRSVAKGAASASGLVVGLLPGDDPDGANPFVTVAVATNLGEARNAIIAQASHCLVAVGDSHGTLSEVALGLRLGKTVFGLAGAAALAEVRCMRDVAELGEALAALLLLQPMNRTGFPGGS